MSRKKGFEVCSVEGCGKPHRAKSYCKKHYDRVKAGNPPEGRSPKTPVKCSVEDCENFKVAKGYCLKHYERLRRQKIRGPKEEKICVIEGCGGPHKSKGYCKFHYARLQRGKPVEGPRLKKPRRPCPVEGCIRWCCNKNSRCIKHREPSRRFRGWRSRTEASIWYNIKGRARKDGIPFDIPKGYIRIPTVCPILGIPLVHNIGKKVTSDNSPSVDRIYPEKGYVVGNIHVISMKANRIKTDATAEEIMKVALYFTALASGKEIKIGEVD